MSAKSEAMYTAMMAAKGQGTMKTAMEWAAQFGVKKSYVHCLASRWGIRLAYPLKRSERKVLRVTFRGGRSAVASNVTIPATVLRQAGLDGFRLVEAQVVDGKILIAGLTRLPGTSPNS